MNFVLILFLPTRILAHIQLHTSFGDHDYFFGRNASTYDIARNRCREIGAELVVIYNETILNHIVQFIDGIEPRPCSFWIGLRRNSSDLSSFVWEDGTPLGTFSKWNSGDGDAITNQDNEKCVVMGLPCNLFSNLWFDIPCEGSQSIVEDYVCQKSKCRNTDTPAVRAASNYLNLAIGLGSLNLLWIFIIFTLLICKKRSKAKNRSSTYDDPFYIGRPMTNQVIQLQSDGIYIKPETINNNNWGGNYDKPASSDYVLPMSTTYLQLDPEKKIDKGHYKDTTPTTIKSSASIQVTAGYRKSSHVSEEQSVDA